MSGFGGTFHVGSWRNDVAQWVGLVWTLAYLRRDCAPWCGIWVVDINAESGECNENFRLPVASPECMAKSAGCPFESSSEGGEGDDTNKHELVDWT